MQVRVLTLRFDPITGGFDDVVLRDFVKDKEILERCVVNRKVPSMGIMVEVNEAFLHCAKAIRRSKLWKPESQQDPSEMPTLAQMILEQVATPDKPPTKEEIKEGDDFIEDNYKTGLY